MRTQIAARVARLLAQQQRQQQQQTAAVASQWSQARGMSANPAPAYDDGEPLPAHKDGKVLHPELLNDNMRKTQYAVRGELYLKAEELKKSGKEIIFTNGAEGERESSVRGRGRGHRSVCAFACACVCAVVPARSAARALCAFPRPPTLLSHLPASF